MKYEKSCGAVVYKIENGVLYFLTEHMVQGHLSIPKGHVEGNETEEETARREILEESGLQVTDLRLRGIITFILPDWGNELTFLYTARTETEELPECTEGELKWIPIGEVLSLPLWEGDRVFIPLLQSRQDCFSLKLEYAPGGALIRAVLDGEELK